MFQVAGIPEGRLGSGTQTPTKYVCMCASWHPAASYSHARWSRVCVTTPGSISGNARRDVHKDCPRCLWGWQRDTDMMLFW